MTTPCVVPVLDAVYLNVVAEDGVNDVVEPVRVRNLGVQRQLHPLRSFRLEKHCCGSIFIEPGSGSRLFGESGSESGSRFWFLMTKNRKASFSPFGPFA